MVTRAAKKQNVIFKIACTGTPVENTLADLWCLFDFVQLDCSEPSTTSGGATAVRSRRRRTRRRSVSRTEEVIAPQISETKDLPEIARNERESVSAVPILLSTYQRSLYVNATDCINAVKIHQSCPISELPCLIHISGKSVPIPSGSE